MSNPFILIASIRVKEGKIKEYLKIEQDDMTRKLFLEGLRRLEVKLKGEWK